MLHLDLILLQIYSSILQSTAASVLDLTWVSGSQQPYVSKVVVSSEYVLKLVLSQFQRVGE